MKDNHRHRRLDAIKNVTIKVDHIISDSRIKFKEVTKVKKEEIRHWVKLVELDKIFKHDSSGALHVYEEHINFWRKCADAKSERYEIRNWTLSRGEDQLTHSDIEFLRQEISEEPSLLVKEWDPP